MNKKYNIAIIGAGSSICGQILNMLVERNFPYGNVHVLAAVNTAGKKVSFGEDKTLIIEDVRSFDFSKVNITFVCPGSDTTRAIIAKVTDHGGRVIDLSGLYKFEQNIPAIVPEVNPYDIKDTIISSPHPCSVALTIALSPLHNAAKIRRITISTYQAVSDLGTAGMDELYNQTKSKYMHTNLSPQIFDKQIAFNIIPQIGELESNDNAMDEEQIICEIQKILQDKIKVNVTCVRVPVFIGHMISVNVEFNNKMDAKEACELLEEEDTISLNQGDNILSPIDIVGDDLIYISRLRNDTSTPNALNFMVATDNLRKGTALNAVQIAETFTKEKA